MIERYTDPLDEARHMVDVATAANVRYFAAKAKPEQVRNPDGTWPTTECVDCGEDIEDGRLEMGKVRCFRCQTIKERKEKGLW